MSTDLLAEIDNLLVSALARATLLPDSADRVEQCGQVILAFRLELARRAVADLLAYQSPARRDPSSSSAGEIATPGGPVQAARGGADRAGEPPLPGAGTFSLPPMPAPRPFAVRTPPFELAGGPLYDVLPKP